MTTTMIPPNITTPEPLAGGEAAVIQLEKRIGVQIKELRRAANLSQTLLAETANVSLGALKNLESGRGATTRTLVRVLRALNADSWLNTLANTTPVFDPLKLPGLKPPNIKR